LALCIAKAKKPFAITEELVTPCMKDICSELLGELVSNKLNCVLSSTQTVGELMKQLNH
jgi:hypothetical protein